MSRVPPYQHGIHLSLCRPLADFGQGFYTTTNLHQAKNWARLRCLRLPTGRATVLAFDVDRNLLARPDILCFVTESLSPPHTDYWDLVHYCRQRQRNHYPGGNYDIVYGPVSLWPQTLVIKDCDQVSFHTRTALMVLATPRIEAQAPQNDRLNI